MTLWVETVLAFILIAITCSVHARPPAHSSSLAWKLAQLIQLVFTERKFAPASGRICVRVVEGRWALASFEFGGLAEER